TSEGKAEDDANKGAKADKKSDNDLKTKDTTSAAVTAAFAAATEQNGKTKIDLNWTFGGKSQRGWNLYVPLIRQLIKTDGDPGTSEFAAALAGWQKTTGLAPTGVLDRNTWLKMVAAFQSRRIKDRIVPGPAQLTLVPTSECFDPERPENLRYMDSQAY